MHSSSFPHRFDDDPWGARPHHLCSLLSQDEEGDSSLCYMFCALSSTLLTVSTITTISMCVFSHINTHTYAPTLFVFYELRLVKAFILHDKDTLSFIRETAASLLQTQGNNCPVCVCVCVSVCSQHVSPPPPPPFISLASLSSPPSPLHTHTHTHTHTHLYFYLSEDTQWHNAFPSHLP